MTISPDISIVIPVHNEEANCKNLVQKTCLAMRNYNKPFELIIVDDGSSDHTFNTLKSLKTDYPELCIITFRRNFGQSAAMTAGFEYAKGKYVVTMDGDLQNDPEDIPELIKKLEEGYDLVSGWRKKRKDPLSHRKIPSMIANWLIRSSTKVRLHDYGCSLKAYRADLAKNLLLYGELHRFIPVLSNLYGAKISEVVVNHHARKAGKSKYGIDRTIRVILDLILMLFFQKYATRPMQFFGLTGGIIFFVGFLIELYLLWVKFGLGEDIGTRPLLLLGAILIVSGIFMTGMGLMAEIITRTYYESSGKKLYSIREIIS
jgi:glycosyltransferase involved in cell wall biosynthesis